MASAAGLPAVTGLFSYTQTFHCGDGFSMPAYLTRPERDGAYPGIVFVFEAFGLNAEMRRVADELAASGYVVMIPDLFSRGSWFGCIRRMVRDLLAESGRTVADLLVARDWLAGQGCVQAGRMAV